MADTDADAPLPVNPRAPPVIIPPLVTPLVTASLLVAVCPIAPNVAELAPLVVPICDAETAETAPVADTDADIPLPVTKPPEFRFIVPELTTIPLVSLVVPCVIAPNVTEAGVPVEPAVPFCVAETEDAAPVADTPTDAPLPDKLKPEEVGPVTVPVLLTNPALLVVCPIDVLPITIAPVIAPAPVVAEPASMAETAETAPVAETAAEVPLPWSCCTLTVPLLLMPVVPAVLLDDWLIVVPIVFDPDVFVPSVVSKAVTPTDATAPVADTDALEPLPTRLKLPVAPTLTVPPGVVTVPVLLITWPMLETPPLGKSKPDVKPVMLLLVAPTEPTTPVVPMDAPLNRPVMLPDVVTLSPLVPVTGPALVMGAAAT